MKAPQHIMAEFYWKMTYFVNKCGAIFGSVLRKWQFKIPVQSLFANSGCYFINKSLFNRAKVVSPYVFKIKYTSEANSGKNEMIKYKPNKVRSRRKICHKHIPHYINKCGKGYNINKAT